MRAPDAVADDGYLFGTTRTSNPGVGRARSDGARFGRGFALVAHAKRAGSDGRGQR